MNKTVKGFTLIELVVVMAIFGIIMAAAVQLMQPVSKTMVYSQIREEGNAAVSNISSYLENQLSCAEYLDIYNTLSDESNPDDTLDARVRNFAEYYYEGVLKSGSTVDSQTYATGQIHVMVIDNSDAGKGKITDYVYDADFTNENVSVSLPENGKNEWAVNKAFYDKYSYKIKIGVYDSTNWDTVPEDSYLDISSNLAAKNTRFTILGETKRTTLGVEKVYNFSSVATMSLVNIYNRNGGGSPNYFVVNQPADTTQAKTIVSITEPQTIRKKEENKECHLARYWGQLSTGTRIMHKDTASSLDSYCFIYSYASEIDIQ